MEHHLRLVSERLDQKQEESLGQILLLEVQCHQEVYHLGEEAKQRAGNIRKGEGQHFSDMRMYVQQNHMTLLERALHRVVVTAMTVAIVIPKGENIITWMGLVLRREIR